MYESIDPILKDEKIVQIRLEFESESDFLNLLKNPDSLV